MPNHILIVDDGAIKTLNIQDRLAKLGYEVIALIDNSEQSLTKAAHAAPDLVLLDFLHDLETNDTSIAERVKKVLDIPVIFVTSKESHSPEFSKTKLPPPGFILKPFDDLELQAAIKLALDSNRLRINTEKKNKKKVVINDFLVAENAYTTNKNNSENPRKSKTEALDFIRQIPIFAKLPEKALSELVSRSQFANVAAGEYIAFEGDQDEASFIVISGRFAMTKTAVSGKELIVELLGPGDFFGLLFAIEDLPAQLSARAQNDSEILWIQTSLLQSVLKENPALYKGFAEYLSHCLHLSHNLSHGLAHDNVRVRIASLLLSLVAKFARIKKEVSSPIVIDITRKQIADLTGTTPETATRVTRMMHNDGVINCGNPGVLRIIDVDALKKIAAEENF